MADQFVDVFTVKASGYAATRKFLVLTNALEHARILLMKMPCDVTIRRSLCPVDVETDDPSATADR